MTLARVSNQMFPSFLDRFFEGDLNDWNSLNFSSTNTTLPRVNVKEDDDRFLIEVAAPGMKKNDFQISFDNGKLEISSEAESRTAQERERYTRREFSYQAFTRTFTVSPEMVDGDKIKASYADGILQIALPKREEVKPKPARKIAIG